MASETESNSPQGGLTEDEIAELQLRERQQVHDGYLMPRLTRLDSNIRHALTGLGASNGAAALGLLSFLGSTWSDETISRVLLIQSLLSFVAGLLVMVVGLALYALSEIAVLKRVERAESWRELPADAIQSPTEAHGWTFKDPRSHAVIFSALLFVAGCAFGAWAIFA